MSRSNLSLLVTLSLVANVVFAGNWEDPKTGDIYTNFISESKK